MASLLGVTTRRINQLAAEGLLIRQGDAGFDGPASIQRYIEHISGKGRCKEGALDAERESARLKKEQADWQELKNAKERRELISAIEAEYAWAEQITRLRSGLLAIPSRVRQRTSISLEDSVALDREIRDAMKVLSEVQFADEEASERDRIGDGAPVSSDEDQPAGMGGTDDLPA